MNVSKAEKLKIKRALILAAGLGTRMRPLTHAVPKELVPVGERPMIHYSVLDLCTSGVNEIYIVTNKTNKSGIEQYFRKAGPALDQDNISTEHNLVFLDQERPYGIWDAIERARSYLDTAPFYLVMPDNIYFHDEPLTLELKACFEEYNQNVVGLIEVKEAEAKRFGNSGKAETEPMKDKVYEITSLQDKAKGGFNLDERKSFKTCGWYLLKPNFFEHADRIDRAVLLEKDETPVIQSLIKEKGMLGVLLNGKLFDCGNWTGYWAANKHWMQTEKKWN